VAERNVRKRGGLSSNGPDAIERITRLLTEVLHIEVANLDTDLIETGVLDSLLMVDLLFHIEQEFGISIPLNDESLDSLRTVRGISEMILHHGGLRRRELA
jgi:acyl carrier protein